MTREDIKIIIDIVHKTIYGFFDVCGDDEETPMTDKDKLLLKVNKAICNNIKALEQEPCDYTISHDAVLQAVSEGCQELRGVYGRCEELINNLPPIPQPCGDAINRQAAIDEVNISNLHPGIVDALQSILAELPPVTAEPKTGHWINGDDKCPCCGKSKFEGLDADIWADWQPKYCPNCGCRMVEPQESEE